MKQESRSGKAIQPAVFGLSAALIAFFVILSFLYTSQLGETFRSVQRIFTTYAGWIYVVGVNFFLLFSIWLMFSRYGEIRLGGPKAKPEFSGWAWMAMLFSAGMGIGLVFWSIPLKSNFDWAY